jgi:ketosteroid isomerase-like protein
MHRATFAMTLVAAAACQPAAATLSDERKAEIIDEVSAQDAAYWDAWRAADWDRGMAFYLDSPDFVWAAGGAMTFGLDALEELEPRFANVASQMYAFADSRVVVMAPDAAVVTAVGAWSQTDSAGVTTPQRDFAWTALWVLHDGEWKMQLVHMSYPAPLPAVR